MVSVQASTCTLYGGCRGLNDGPSVHGTLYSTVYLFETCVRRSDPGTGGLDEAERDGLADPRISRPTSCQNPKTLQERQSKHAHRGEYEIAAY